MNGTLLLDCEGLSQIVRNTQWSTAFLAMAGQERARIAVCAMTIIEADRRKVRSERLSWVLSQMKIEDVDEKVARLATRLLRQAGDLHGHKYAIDASVAAIARLTAYGPVTVVTSDVEDMTVLCGPGVTVERI
ncbi:MAG TPA: hypothetical protein VGM10_33200 [Actinocrinis sp.]